MSWPSLLLGSGQGQPAPPRSSNDAILPTFKDVRQFLLSWPFYVIRTRMEISDTGFWTELKALREEGQLMPGPMQLWRGVVPGWCHNLLFHLVQRSMCVLLRKLFMKPKKMPALQYDRWSQKMNKLERLTAENRLRDSEGHSTVQLALSAARPLVKAATGERESIDVAIDAASAIIAALVSYPFLVISTFSITGAMSLSQIFAMIKMGLQAKKSKSGGAEGSKPRSGNKMLSMVGGMLFKGVKYRVAGVVISYGLRAVSHWLLLKLLERALRVAENALGQKKRAEQENEEEEEELEEIGSARSRQLGPANDYKELIALAKKFGVQMVAVLAVDLLIKHILSHPFEVMSARERVSVPVRQGSLWRGFFLRACFGSFYS